MSRTKVWVVVILIGLVAACVSFVANLYWWRLMQCLSK